MTVPLDESLCPLCGADNSCMADAGPDCWCVAYEVPDRMLRLVPQEKNGIVCICRNCIESFRDDPEGFQERYLDQYQ